MISPRRGEDRASATMNLIAALRRGAAMSFTDTRGGTFAFGYVTKAPHDQLAFDSRMTGIAIWSRTLSDRELHELQAGANPCDVAPSASICLVP